MLQATVYLAAVCLQAVQYAYPRPVLDEKTAALPGSSAQHPEELPAAAAEVEVWGKGPVALPLCWHDLLAPQSRCFGGEGDPCWTLLPLLPHLQALPLCVPHGCDHHQLAPASRPPPGGHPCCPQKSAAAEIYKQHHPVAGAAAGSPVRAASAGSGAFAIEGVRGPGSSGRQQQEEEEEKEEEGLTLRTHPAVCGQPLAGWLLGAYLESSMGLQGYLAIP